MDTDGSRTSSITKRVEFLCAAVSGGIAGALQLSDICPTGPLRYAFRSKTRHSPQSAHPESRSIHLRLFRRNRRWTGSRALVPASGGASGTVAKTISAYDKEVSDDLYGSGSRYVSKQRLEAMLDNEWTQLLTQLSKSRGSQTRFFCFVDTVSARNFAGTNDSHAWTGLRFQLQPGDPPNDILLDVNMRDASNALQQQAIGILGVNLIYAAFYEGQTKESFLAGLAQDVVAERIEIDYVDLRGPAFESWDCRALLVHLVRAGLAEAVFFSSKGSLVPPAEVLHKKAVVLAPGYFGHTDPVHSQVHLRLLASGIQELQADLGETNSAPAGFFCLTVAPFRSEEHTSELPDLLRRIDALLAAGGDEI